MQAGCDHSGLPARPRGPVAIARRPLDDDPVARRIAAVSRIGIAMRPPVLIDADREQASGWMTAAATGANAASRKSD